MNNDVSPEVQNWKFISDWMTMFTMRFISQFHDSDVIKHCTSLYHQSIDFINDER